MEIEVGTAKEWWWVTADFDAYGPFDTERDAHIARVALNNHVGWMGWWVVSEPT